MASEVQEAPRRALTIFLMGSGGDGVITAGELLARAAAHDGLGCHLTKSFGPQIRGGESAVWLQVSADEVRSPAVSADVVMALSWESFPRFAGQLDLSPGTLVLVDEADSKAPDQIEDREGNPLTAVRVPIRRLAEEETGSQLGRNLVALGFLSALLGLPAETIPQAIAKRLKKRGGTVVANNVRAFERGQALAGESLYVALGAKLARGDKRPRIFMSGNDAVTLGALYSGVEFFAGYPITPASEILSSLAAELPGIGGTVIQAEDEIAAMTMVIGASFGGKKAMTATSGPGLSLKTEAIGLAAHAEIPCVIVNVQRGGPSTGMPTMTEQADIQLAVYGAHGDVPRVVIAATDTRGCYEATVKAFYLAERYQTPVIVLTDQLIGHRLEALPADSFEPHESFSKVNRRTVPEDNPTEPYKRYRLGRNPISPMSHPGIEGCAYRTSGIVHQENGCPTSDAGIHHVMNEKRQRKMDMLLKEMGGFQVVGPDEAEFGIISWGSTSGAALDAAARLTARGRRTSVCIVELLHPLPAEGIAAYAAKRRHLAVAELSYSAQFARLLRSEGVPLLDALLIHRGGGHPLLASEIERRLEEQFQ